MYSKKLDRSKDVSARDLSKFIVSNVDDLPIETRKIAIKRNHESSNKSLLRDPGSLKMLTDESPKV